MIFAYLTFDELHSENNYKYKFHKDMEIQIVKNQLSKIN